MKWSLFFGFVALSLAFVAGCGGGDSVPRSHVSGSVKYDGKPVPAGKIYFSPDKGNSGPQGFTDITDGRYDTRVKGKGGPGGATVVRIEGFDGASDETRPMGHAVFVHEIKIDLPATGDGTKDFDIKESEAKKLPKSTETPP